MGPADSSRPTLSSSFSSFSLDNHQSARNRSTDTTEAAELDSRIQRLMHETRLWRVVNSAHWVAWGVVQAHIPNIPAELDNMQESEGPELVAGQASDPLDADAVAAAEDLAERRPEDGEAESEEFDYLSYARDRALFFWGDVLKLGIVERSELPEELLERVKMLDH